MPGLNLRAAGGLGVAASLPPSYAEAPAPTSISARAYGINAGGNQGSATPAYGAVGAGIAATALLVWLWYSLPR